MPESEYNPFVFGAPAIPVLAMLRLLAGRQGGLALLVLFGSRARGDVGPHSDWDFGFLVDGAVDSLALLAALTEGLGTDRVDLVDLGGASGVLRYRAARDGLLVYEAQPGLLDRFCFDAARFWYDAELVVGPEYERILDCLG